MLNYVYSNMLIFINLLVEGSSAISLTNFIEQSIENIEIRIMYHSMSDVTTNFKANS